LAVKSELSTYSFPTKHLLPMLSNLAVKSE
jgi:hypothetical protein